jgi:peptidoglycan/LPS O-acetylase OafA/YrhL
VALELAGVFAGLALVVSALTERSTALPVATAVWCVPVGLAAVIAALVRLLERPEAANGLAAGGWLALVGALAVLAGAWETLRDEHTTLYRPASPPPQPRP